MDLKVVSTLTVAIRAEQSSNSLTSSVQYLYLVGLS